MTDNLSPLNKEPFSDAVAQLERLLSLSNRAFLLGAGCSSCAGLPLMGQLTQEICGSSELTDPTRKLLNSLVQQFEGSTTATIEAYMSELVDMLSIAERRSDCEATNCAVKINGIDYSVESLRNALSEIKGLIARCIDNKSVTLSTHQQFIQAIHNTLQSGKLISPSTVDYFTLNYDTLLEDALALECIPYSDGFSGGATGWWNQSCFDEKKVAARVFKVHGSIDWCLFEDEVLPRRVRPNIASDESIKKVMIWPAATKYREAQRDPYAQMISRMRLTLRPKENCDTIFTICGYRFGDSHINIELDRALRDSERRLTVIAFTDELEPKGQLKKWIEDRVVRDQIRIYAKGGFYHGNDRIKSNEDLPWWKFEIITRLLRGER
jgi:hypothetical protein